MENNVDFVSARPDKDWYTWTFELPAHAKDISDEPAEITNVCKSLFKISEGFLRPLSLEMSVSVFESDYPLGEVRSHLDCINRVETTEGRFEQPLRQLEMSIKNTRTTEGESKFIVEIEFQEIATKLWLPDFDAFVGPDHERFRNYREGEQSPLAPLEIVVEQSSIPPEYDDRTEFESCYRISIRSNTDVWFEDSEVGAKNRERLSSVFDGIAAEFDLLHTDFVAEGFTKEHLQTRPHLQSIAPREAEFN